MTQLITITLITIIFLSYVIWITIKNKGILSSISDSWYRIPGAKKMFPAFCLSIGILLIISDPTQVLNWLMCGGFIFVGGAPKFRKHVAKQAHFGGAFILITIGMIQVILYGYWQITLIGTISIILLILFYQPYQTIKEIERSKQESKLLFWIEILAFLTIITGYWVNALNI